MLVKNIIFDLDNTLYSCTSAMDRGITGRMMTAVADFFAVDLDKAAELRNNHLPKFSTTLEWLRSEGLTDTEGYFKKVHPENEADELPFDGNLRPFLQSLSQKKIVLTNSPREHADRVLKKLNISDLFDGVVDIRACSLLGKPYPGSYQKALQMCGGSIEDSIFLDDQQKYTDGFSALGGTAVLVGSRNGRPLAPDSDALKGECSLKCGRTLKIDSVYMLPDLLNKL